MPRLLEEILIINSESETDYIPFFRRTVGDTGRDIAAVKQALGEAYYLPQEGASEPPEDNSIGTSWFDCSGGGQLTQKKLRFFDRSLKVRLMNYQLENQFVILSYYFEKYCIRNVTDSDSLSILVQTALNFFDSEFGSIGDGTIACLHGWRPNSIAYNHSFVTDNEIVIDQVPQLYKEMINQNFISEPSAGIISEIVTSESGNYTEIAESFDKNTHSSKKLLNIVSDTPVVYPVYTPTSFIGTIVESRLHAAAQQIMSTNIERDVLELKAQDRYRVLSPMLEPDPLSDPGPFEIGSGKIGFFDRTEFTLETLPNFTNVEQTLRRHMEDAAFHEVLKFYNKPVVWHLTKDLHPEDEIYFSDTDREEQYLQIVENKQHYRVTTRAAIAEFSLDETQYDAILGEHLVSVNKFVPINFIEYRTPSLRPGDVYRSYFEITSSLLELIQTGDTEKEFEMLNSIPGELNRETLSFMRKEIANMHCIEGANSEAAALVKFEKYKAFAMKRKLEISRNMRDAAMQASLGQEVNVDMGVAGILFEREFSLTGEEIVESTFEGLTNIINRFAEPQPKPDSIRMSVKLFRESIEGLVKVFRSDKVAEDVRKFKISGNGISRSLDLNVEADRLASWPSYLENLAHQWPPLRKAAKNANMTVADLMQGESTFIQGTSFKIDFVDLQVSQISVINMAKGINEIIWSSSGKANGIAVNPLRGALSLPRTVNYVRNINNILPLPPSNFLAYVEDFIGLTSSPCSDSSDGASLPASLILRYTINNSGSPAVFERGFDFENAVHNWKDNVLQEEEISRLKDFFDNVFKNPIADDRVRWGVDTILPEIGEACDLKEMYKHVVSTRNMSKLLCNYLTCLKIPDVNVKIPKLMLPEFKDIPLFALPGLEDLHLQFLEAIEGIFSRIICAIVKNLLDILKTPFCEDQLVRDLYGAAADSGSEVQRAFASAFLDVGVPKEKTSNVQNLLDALINFLTPRELCALLQGAPVNTQVYNMIENLAENYNLQEEFAGREKISEFFAAIGIYIPDELCQALNSNNILGIENCQDTGDLLTSIRNAAARGAVDSQQVEQAVAQAEKNLREKSLAYELLTGEVSLEDLIPTTPSEDLSENQALKEVTQLTVDTALQVVKSSFISSMSAYVSSIYLNVEQVVSVDDFEYDPIATMKFFRAANNLQRVQAFNLNNVDFQSQSLTVYLRKTLLRLCDDFEKVEYGDFQIYRSQLDTLNRDEIDNPDQIVSQTSENIEGDNENRRDFSPYGNINTTLKGSLVFGDGLSEQAIESGITGLFGINTSQRIEASTRLQMQREYSKIFEYLFPLSIEVQPLDEELTAISEEPVLSSETTTEVVNSWPQFVLDKYKGTNFYEAGGDGVQYDLDPRNVSINVSYLKAIVSTIERLQQDIRESLEAVFKVVNKEKLLEIIRDFYNIDLEALREESGEIGRGQLIKTELITSGQRITLEHPVADEDGVSLMSTVMDDKTVSQNYISNRTKIRDSFFLGSSDNPITEISLCEEVPDEYKNYFSSEDTDNPLRRKVFKAQLAKIAKHYYDNYKTQDSEEFENLDGLDLLDEAEEAQYLNVLEGVVEQMISYLGTSKMFTDEAFLSRLDAKLKAKPYFSPQGDNICIINPLGSFSEGAVKFDEIVTRTFSKEYSREILDPENSVYTLDYTKPGAFEKAMITTAVLGYIRIVCLEALLKGAVAYSSWDIDFVTPDPLFRQYLYKLVENTINGQESFQEYPVLLDDALRKISGTNNRVSAIRTIVDRELATTISALSKVLFENSTDQKYINWFLNRMFIVDAPVQRRQDVAFKGEWISELSESDIDQYRKNSFTYMERYIRTNGQLNGILPNPEGLAAAQRNALFDFIRFEDSGYPASLAEKLYSPQDPEFMAIPIQLDIPSRQQVEDFNIGEQGNLTELRLDLLDNDQWPEKELYSLEDFNDLMVSIFQNNPGVQKYIFHLLKKYYDEADQNSIWHGKPKTLRNKMPIKAVKRRRKYYRFYKEDLFSTRFAEDFEGILHTAGRDAAIERDDSSLVMHRYLSPEAEPLREASESGFLEAEYYSKRYEDRYYIVGVHGHQLFDDVEPKQGLDIDCPYQPSEVFFENAPPRGINPILRTASSESPPWANFLEHPSPTGIDKIETVLKDWVNEETGLQPGAKLYENTAGKVSKSQFQAFTNATSGILEEEVWEEYVVDLLEDAAPFFNQPGYSEFNSATEITNQDARVIADNVDQAADYVPHYDSNTYAEKKNIFCPDTQPEGRTGAVFTSTLNTATSVDDPSNSFEQADLCGPGEPDIVVSRLVIARGPGFEKHDVDTGSRNIPAKKHAFFKNDIRAVYDPAVEKYVIKSNSETLLEHNEYKIPVRMLITQVKSRGEITKVFVRYLIPKVVTFSVDDSSRGSKVTQAVVDISQGYVNFYEDLFQKGTTEQNPRAERLRNSAIPARAEQYSQDEAEGQAYAGKEKFAAANFLLGMENGYEDGGHCPVLYRDSVSRLPGRSSHGLNFFSISKIWSLAAHIEANRSTGHFEVDDTPTEYSKLDEFFKQNVGQLLRKPTGIQANYQDLLNQFSTQLGLFGNMNGNHALDSDNLNYSEAAAARAYLYNRASQHSLYDMDFETMIQTDKLSSIISIGNLVGWFSQRRVDGFYGATSKGCEGTFNKAGVLQEGASPSTSVSLDVLRDEAADFDCGPSLFYGDGRTLIESYMASLYNYMNVELEGNLDTPLASTSYKFYFDAFREQNMYKICDSVFRTPDEAPNAQGPSLWRTERTEQTDRPKTLASHRCDIRSGQVVLNQVQRDFLETGLNLTGYPSTILGPDTTFISEPGEIYPFFSNLNLTSLPRGNFDTAFHNPKRSTQLFDQIKTDVVIGTAFSSPETLDDSLTVYLEEIKQLDNLRIHFSRLQAERERYPILLQEESDRFDRTLQWANNLITELYKILAGLNPEAISLLQALDVKHGLRLNLVLGQDSTDPVLAGLGVSSPAGGIGNLGSGLGSGAGSNPTIITGLNDTRKFFNNLWSSLSEVSEEERIGKINYRTNEGSEEQFENYTSVPMAFHERSLYLQDICDPDINFVGVPSLVRSRDQEMIEALSEKEDFKTFYEFSVPYRRLGSLLTIHGTSMLAGYNDMPSILQSTKSSLAGVFRIMAERNDFDSTKSKVFGSKFNNIEIMNAMGSSFPVGGEELDCFSLPGLNEWFTMIKEMIEQYIKYFPSVILRGLADQMDPMYKEMKSHYFACEIPSLKMDSVTMRSGDGKTQFGLKGEVKGQKKYAPVFPSFPVDLGIGTSRMLKDGDLRYLGISIDKMISYAIGGPRQLIDATYAFQIPCLEDERFNRSGDFRNWSKYRIGNHGRYGHPLTLLGGLALSTRHLPRDLEYRSKACQIQSMAGTAPQVCDDTEE